MPSQIKILLDPQIVAFSSNLHPEHRRAIKAAIRDLASHKGDIKPLDKELLGFSRLKIGSYRIIFHRNPDGTISCLFIDRRETVYKRFTPPA